MLERSDNATSSGRVAAPRCDREPRRPTRPVTILVVEDDPDYAELVQDFLTHVQGINLDFQWADSLSAALKGLTAGGIDVVLLDLNLPDSHGLDTFDRIRAQTAEVPVVVLSGDDDETTAIHAVQRGAQDYLVKGAANGDLIGRAIRYAIERKRAEGDLRRMARTAHRFVDNVAHEFRTPLMVITQFAEIIADGLGGPVTDQQREYLQHILTSTRDLGQLVDDLLDSSRLKAGTLRVDRRRCSVAEIVASVRPMLQNKAATRSITLAEEIPADLPDVFADRDKAGRALINLAVNAIKFSPEGSGVLLWAAAGRDAGVHLGITDQGRGMSGEELQVVFDRFQQIGDGSASGREGSGLGLHIVKELVHLNLGKLHVDSRPGQGSTFSFTLPQYGWGEIVRSYSYLLGELGEGTPLSVIEVALDESGSSLAPIRGLIAGTCRPMDVVLGGEDGRRLIVLGQTDAPEAWARRLHAARAKALSGAGEAIPQIRIAPVGTWSCPGESAAAVDAALELLAGRIPVG